ncbi:hypothetical protein Pla110_04150 [Polystyrenella longa]|uniref:DUF1570 domain-containing protein n=2 Tax=Polystyrenella longa TaxID=2528007 RepID=A0A518CHL6_9PLAN|nr:hypothetical protein Pla110_04150 [Polystyrenella longa]
MTSLMQIGNSVLIALMRALFLMACLLLGPNMVQAAGDWIEICEGDAFICRSEVKVGQTELPAMLKILRSEIEQKLGLESSDELLELYLFRNRRNFVEYVSQRIPEGASRQALYVKGEDRSRIYIYNHLAVRDDIRHECTHAILHHSLPYLPLWMDEGLAEYFEVEHQMRSTGNSHLGEMRFSMFFRHKPNMRELEQLNSLTEMDKSDYRDSWAWIHFLIHESEESRQLLLEYLKEIREGEPPGPFSVILYRAMPNADERLKRHIKSWK